MSLYVLIFREIAYFKKSGFFPFLLKKSRFFLKKSMALKKVTFLSSLRHISLPYLHVYSRYIAVSDKSHAYEKLIVLDEDYGRLGLRQTLLL